MGPLRKSHNDAVFFSLRLCSNDRNCTNKAECSFNVFILKVLKSIALRCKERQVEFRGRGTTN